LLLVFGNLSSTSTGFFELPYVSLRIALACDSQPVTSMFRIVETGVDASGHTDGKCALPLVFNTRAEAVTFISAYLRQIFVDGRSGYRLAEDYWWGCENDSQLRIRRYQITSD
jgi:hypothetical protein